MSKLNIYSGQLQENNRTPVLLQSLNEADQLQVTIENGMLVIGSKKSASRAGNVAVFAPGQWSFYVFEN